MRLPKRGRDGVRLTRDDYATIEYVDETTGELLYTNPRVVFFGAIQLVSDGAHIWQLSTRLRVFNAEENINEEFHILSRSNTPVKITGLAMDLQKDIENCAAGRPITRFKTTARILKLGKR